MDNYTIGGMMTDASAIEALFSKGTEETQEPEVEEEKDTDTDTNDQQKDITEEQPDIESLFGPEKVGNDEEETEEKKEPSQKPEPGSSPKNPYSSIAYAMFEEGVLSNLSEDDLKDVKDAESLVSVMDKYVNTRLDEQQKRVIDALDAGIETTVIKQYEDTITALNKVTEDSIEAETPEGENLRKAIIYQYYIDKGESQDRANKMVERALSGGTDIEDAKEFLEELKTSTQNKYAALIEDNKQQLQNYKKKQEAELNKAKKSILEDEHILGDVVVDRQTRQKALDYWLKPVYKKEDGTYMSELQKYANENPQEFQIKMALLFAMSDKFKNPEKIARETVKKEKKKAMKELETVINGTQMSLSGGIDFGFKDENTNFNTFNLASPEQWRK
jgi:hypothetical protein